MSQLQIAFRTDANQEIGTGHFMRCFTLANELIEQDAEISFVSRDLPSHLQNMLIERSIKYHSLPISNDSYTLDELAHSEWLKTSQTNDANMTIELLNSVNWDWMIIDHYALDYRFEKQMRGITKHIMVIDDLADRAHDCDVLLDQNFYHDQQQRYEGKLPINCRQLLGPSHALLRQEFTKMHPLVNARTGNIGKILVFFGGVDAGNLTGTALNILIGMNIGVDVDVVIGFQHPRKEEIIQFCKIYKFNIYVQTTDMPALMAQADLAIGSGGTSIWERCSMGLPSICIVSADNQREQIEELNNANLIIAPHQFDNTFDFLPSIIKNLISQPEILQDISSRSLKMVDGLGAVRVASALKVHRLQLRLVETKDAKNIFQWRNHPQVRENSTNHGLISWEEHSEWFNKRISNLDGPLLIGEIENKPVGVVRFDIIKSSAEVSIYLVPDVKIKGLGGCLLEKAEMWLNFHYPNISKLHAKVLFNNEPSKRMFAKLNYSLFERKALLEFSKELGVCV